MSKFKTIGLVGRISKPETVETLDDIVAFLLSRKLNVLLSDDVAALLVAPDLKTYSRSELGKYCDLVVVVGGDGSMLGAARDLCRSKVPVVGVNRGRLGFLTDVLPQDVESQLGAILDGEYRLEERALLSAKLVRDGKTVEKNSAFNDVVLSSAKAARMIEFEIYVDDVYVTHQRGDGLIVSTPTGSTAYSLSAGGPIMYPTLNAMVIVPMFPHKLTSRPIVLHGDSEIRLEMSTDNELGATLSSDGHSRVEVKPGDHIIVRKKKKLLKMLHPVGHDFYAACRDKLGWG